MDLKRAVLDLIVAARGAASRRDAVALLENVHQLQTDVATKVLDIVVAQAAQAGRFVADWATLSAFCSTGFVDPEEARAWAREYVLTRAFLGRGEFAELEAENELVPIQAELSRLGVLKAAALSELAGSPTPAQAELYQLALNQVQGQIDLLAQAVERRTVPRAQAPSGIRSVRTR